MYKNILGQVPGSEMFYDYRATTYKWVLPHNSLSESVFSTINDSFVILNSTAYVIVDSYSKNDITHDMKLQLAIVMWP